MSASARVPSESKGLALIAPTTDDNDLHLKDFFNVEAIRKEGLYYASDAIEFSEVGKTIDFFVPGCLYDLIVIGGGPAGFAAASKAALLGKRVLIVDKPRIVPMSNRMDISFGGPTGLFSKALRDASRELDVASMQRLGLDNDVIWQMIYSKCQRRAAVNSVHQVQSLADTAVDYIQGCAKVLGADRVQVIPQHKQVVGDSLTMSTKNVIVATGSKPVRPSNVPFDDIRVFDTDAIHKLRFLPRRVVIIGAGFVAIEYAKIFRQLNADVTMLIRHTLESTVMRLGLDPDICSILKQGLIDDKVQIHEKTVVTDYILPIADANSIRLLLRTNSEHSVTQEIECDIVIAALGREPRSGGLGLEDVGLDIAKDSSNGFIKVNEQFQTSLLGVYAVGDVIGPPYLASVAVHQAQSAVSAMFEDVHVVECMSYPIGMWSTPECSYYGLSRLAAEQRGIVAEEGIAHYDRCLRGRMFTPDGMFKLVFDACTGVVLGVHVIGQDACELVHYGMNLVEQESTIFTLMTTVYVAWTYHELFREAAIHGNSKLNPALRLSHHLNLSRRILVSL